MVYVYAAFVVLVGGHGTTDGESAPLSPNHIPSDKEAAKSPPGGTATTASPFQMGPAEDI